MAESSDTGVEDGIIKAPKQLSDRENRYTGIKSFFDLIGDTPDIKIIIDKAFDEYKNINWQEILNRIGAEQIESDAQPSFNDFIKVCKVAIFIHRLIKDKNELYPEDPTNPSMDYLMLDRTKKAIDHIAKLMLDELDNIPEDKIIYNFGLASLNSKSLRQLTDYLQSLYTTQIIRKSTHIKGEDDIRYHEDTLKLFKSSLGSPDQLQKLVDEVVVRLKPWGP
ncbi:hypothetical protein HYW46_04565 [Candidatus Daviesbacteria bacterium]|nr:hypothetical protein [Candidatus Daviesbacteria bacterium]